MSNLKKVLALALAFAMIMTVMVGAIPAYSDSDDFATTGGSTSLLDSAVTTLSDLNIMVGTKTDDGTYFNPTGTLTRAELARLAYALTHSGAVISSTWDTRNVTEFKDISTSWAKGYINYGYIMGYLSGKSATKFDPNGIVTGYELGSVLVRLVRGYAASDIAVWPYDVEKLGRTFGANLFTLGNNVEVDLAQPITRQNAAVLLYNAVNSYPVTLNTNGTAYQKDTETFLTKNYPAYAVGTKAIITAVGTIGTNGTDGYITAFFDDTTAANKDVTYKLASTKATQAAILADPSILTLLGTQVAVNAGTDTTTIKDATIATSFTDTGKYKTIAVAKKDVGAAADYIGNKVAVGTQGQPGYVAAVAKLWLAFTSNGTSYSGAVDKADVFVKNLKNETDTLVDATTADGFLKGSNSDLVLFTVEGTTIVDVQGAFKSTFAEVKSVAADGKTIKFGTSSTEYVNQGVTVKAGDFVLYQVLSDTAVTTGNVTKNYHNAYVSAVVSKATYKVTTLKSGVYYAGDTALPAVSGIAFDAALTAPVVTNLNPGTEYDAYILNGYVYKIAEKGTTSADTGIRDFLYTTADPETAAVQYLLSTDGTKYVKVQVLFANNTIKNIAVRAVEGKAIDATVAGIVNKNVVYKYVKNTDGSYNLFALKTDGASKQYDVDTGVADSTSANYTKAPVVFLYDGTKVIVPSAITKLGTNTKIWTDDVDGFTQEIVAVADSSDVTANANFAPKKEYAMVSGYSSNQSYDGLDLQSTVTVTGKSGSKTLNFVNVSGGVITGALTNGNIVEITYNDAAGTVVNSIANVTAYDTLYTATGAPVNNVIPGAGVTLKVDTVIIAVKANGTVADKVDFSSGVQFYADSTSNPTVIFQLIP